MKVLKEGTGWKIKQTCTGNGNGGGGCGALLEVEKDDLYITSHTDMTGETDYYYTFQCPCCKVETDILESKLPYGIRDYVREKRLK